MSDPKDDPQVGETPEISEVETPTPVNPQDVKSNEKVKEEKNAGPNPFDWIASGTSWGASLVQSAKEKTLATMELVKKDLNEISDTVHHEATALATATAEQVKQQAQLFHKFVTTPDGEDPFDEKKEDGNEPQTKELEKIAAAEAEKRNLPDEKEKARTSSTDSAGFGLGWMKTIVETVKSFGIEDTVQDDEVTEKIVIPQRKSILDQYQLTQIQNDERTYLTAPNESVDLYQDWLKDFKIGEYNGEINMLLGYNPKLREIYAKLVPAKVDNSMFWNRYFFKVYLAELDKELVKNERTVFDELKVETDAMKLRGSKIAKKDSSKSLESETSPANEKDETWSMCSSTNAEIQEIDDEDSGPKTPRANGEESAAEDWEKFEDKESNDSHASQVS